MDSNQFEQILKDIQSQLEKSQDREKVLYDELMQLYSKHYELYELVLKSNQYTKLQDLEDLEDEKDAKEFELYERTRNSTFYDLYH